MEVTIGVKEIAMLTIGVAFLMIYAYIVGRIDGK